METAPKITLPLSVFISYASVSKDEALLRDLEAHLSLLKKLGLITTWHHKKTLAGSNVHQELSEHLETATLILLLVSADLLASEEYDNEIQTALERNKAGEALVIPILLRKVHMESTPLKYLQCLPRDGRPVSLWEDADEAFTTIVAEIRETIEKYPIHQNQRISEKEKRLRILIPDHNGFLKDRLESFVGRQKELAEIQKLITQRLPTGGYITITGQAGQGKSSIIAKLIEIYGVEQVAYHFISINPGPDHQVGLLRNLMARLILKYDLSDLYVASDNRAALRDYFPKVLTDVANQGGQEIIFLDGLDQLEEDFNGVRDLSFLPTNPPSGIVFVLGTRPNDTMKPLELLKPHNEYRLPNLSRQDFDRILLHRNVSLKETIADQFYKIMGENALYLDLVAKELMASDALDPLAIITRITANPTNIFTLSLERLKRQGQLWERVIYPVLGVLLTVQEPLSLPCIRDILQVEDYKLRDGIARLGGLLTEDTQRRYSLFHLKLRDYLRQDTEAPQKEYIFTIEEEEGWHARLAVWCEQGQLLQIWQDINNLIEQGRRIYARQHYITHLYYAHKWQRLFDVLDEGNYGHAKERYDVTTRSYVQDLDRGRQAVIYSSTTLEEAISMLPHLWRYTLLRGSLRSGADQYPQGMFQLLLLLGKEQEVLGLAELLTDPVHKVEILLLMAENLVKQPTRVTECEQLYFRASEISHKIEDNNERAEALNVLAGALAKVQQWDRARLLWGEAEKVAHTIKENDERAWALNDLAGTLVEAQQWERAEEIARVIGKSYQQVRALNVLAGALAKVQQWDRARLLWGEAEKVAHTIKENDKRAWALNILSGTLAEAQQWERAEEVARSIEENDERAEALNVLAGALAKVQQWDRARLLWGEAEEIAHAIKKSDERARVFKILAEALAEAQQWERAEEIARTIEKSDERARALNALAGALAEAQQWDRAGEVARTIEENDERARALNALAGALAEAQQWDRAEEIARTIEKSDERAEALNALAKALAKAQQWDRAEIICFETERLIRLTKESYQQAEALNALAKALAKAQQWDRARLLWGEAKEVARAIEESYQQVRALRGLAEALAEAQQWDRAEEVARVIEKRDERAWALNILAGALAKVQQWDRAEEIARTIEENDERAWALRGLAEALAKVQQWDRAEEIARTIEEDDERAEALSVLAEALAKVQQWDRARLLWGEAEEIARTIEYSNERAEALNVLAEALAKVQQWDRARLLWGEAEEVARSIEENDERAEVLNVLAEALAKVQQWDWARLLWGEAEEVARTIEEEDERAEALNALAGALAKVQQWDWAEEVARTIEEDDERAWTLKALASALAEAQQWDQAEEVARTIEENDERAWALNILAGALAEAQQWDRAEEVARTIEEDDERAKALNALAGVLAKAQQWERARLLWREAEEVARAIEESNQRARALYELADTLLTSHEYQQLISLIHTSWRQVEKRDDAFLFFPLALGLLSLQSEIGEAFYKGFQWVDAFLNR